MLIAKETEIAGFAAEFHAPVALVIVSFVLVMIDGYDMFIVSFLAPLIAADLNLTPVHHRSSLCRWIGRLHDRGGSF